MPLKYDRRHIRLLQVPDEASESTPPAASRCPSGENATDRTLRPLPPRSDTGWPAEVRMSQTRTVPSSPAETRRDPSGE